MDTKIGFSACLRSSVLFLPQRHLVAWPNDMPFAAAGDALLFFDMDIMGQVGDRRALHASCPTLNSAFWVFGRLGTAPPAAGATHPHARSCAACIAPCASLLRRSAASRKWTATAWQHSRP